MVSAGLLILLFVLLPLAACAWIILRGGGELLGRALLCLATLGASVAALELTFAILSGPQHDWNGVRLAPVLAMTRGDPATYPLYQPRGTGVMNAWTHGPVPALIYLPAVIGRSPTSVILIALAINALITLAPAAWLHLQAAPSQGRTFAALMFGVFVWEALVHDSLRQTMFALDAGGPAMALAACSCALLMDARLRQRTWALALAALFAVLSSWCRLIMLPLLLAAPLYLLALGRRRDVLRYLAALAIAGLIVSALLIAGFGATDMRFQMLTLPGARRLQERNVNSLLAVWHGVGALFDLLSGTIVILFAVLTIAALGGAMGGVSRKAWRQWVADNPWSLLLLVALLLTSGAVWAFVKEAGSVTDFGPVHYFLLAAATVAAVQTWPRLQPAALRTFVQFAACVLIATRAALLLLTYGQLPDMLAIIRNPRDNPQETAYRYAAANPGVAYFPWNPLSSLLAENKLYHTEWGLYDRFQSELIPSDAQIVAHLPAKLKLVAFGTAAPSQFSLRIFPRTTQPIRIEELPGFVAFTEPVMLTPPAGK